MAVSNVQISDPSSDLATQQNQDSQQTTARPHGHRHHGGGHESGDRFSPSSSQGSQGSQSSQDTGTYQVTQAQFFSAAASFFLVQTGASPTDQSASTQTPSSSDAPNTSSPTTDPSTTTPDASTPPVTTSLPPTTVQQPGSDPSAISNAITATTPSDTTTSGSQDPLQTLNNALAALGLNQQSIQLFDQIANFIKAFSPTAFNDLVNQFQQLAQQATQGTQDATQAASTPSSSSPTTDSTTTGSSGTPDASGTTTTNAATNNAAPISSNPPAGGTTQIEELKIRFSGVEEQGTNNGGNFEISAFKLQIQEVNITLADGNGNTSQVQTPQQTASS